MSMLTSARRRPGRAVFTRSVVLAAIAAAAPAAADPVAAEARYPSAFDGYRGYEADAPLEPWREVNDRAGTAGGHGAHAADEPTPYAADAAATSTAGGGHENDGASTSVGSATQRAPTESSTPTTSPDDAGSRGGQHAHHSHSGAPAPAPAPSAPPATPAHPHGEHRP